MVGGFRFRYGNCRWMRKRGDGKVGVMEKSRRCCVDDVGNGKSDRQRASASTSTSSIDAR